MGELVVLLFFAAIVVIPLALVIGVVVLISKNNRKKQAAAWQQLAQELGGQFVAGQGAFGGNKITFPRAEGPIVLETIAISVMQAMGVPHFPDGGTYTVVKAQYAGRNGLHILSKPEDPDCERVMPPQASGPCRQLPPDSRVHSLPDEIIVTMRGAVTDLPALRTALTIVSELTRYSASQARAA